MKERWRERYLFIEIEGWIFLEVSLPSFSETFDCHNQQSGVISKEAWGCHIGSQD